jgi:S-adenosylmethionine:tRNA-ribosyltransferase-isomerase (queuine synthetase)
VRNLKESGKKLLAVGTTMARFLETLPYAWKVYGELFSLDKETTIFWDMLTKDINVDMAKKYCPVDDVQSWSRDTIIPTKLFIYPGFEWKLVDQLITNFHLPKSSLLMLVASFMSRETILKAYEYAKNKAYTFYSFGDGMFLRK